MRLRTVLTSLIVMAVATAAAMPVDSTRVALAVTRTLAMYPQATLLDIYKSCFQDAFGPGHIVEDSERSRAWLTSELYEPFTNPPGPDYEPTGIDGNFIRVNLAAVRDGRIPADTLFSALLEGTDGFTPIDFNEWTYRWHFIMSVIRAMGLQLPNMDADADAIEERLARGVYVGHHSRRFEDVYRPHYRIIRRDVFLRRLKPHLQNQ